MTFRRTAARLLAAPAAVGVVLLAAAGPAAAHMTVSATVTAASAYTVLTVSVPHGCDGSATTKVAIRMPEEILSVTPTRNPLWDVTKKRAKLDEPVTDAHGNTVTERDATVVYTAKTPLPDGYRDAFELSLKLPEEEGKTLVFPAIQTCEKGETAWTEVAAEGQDGDELEHPAPTVTITAATSRKEGSIEDEDEGSNMLGAAGLSTGVLALLAGGAALVQARRRP